MDKIKSTEYISAMPNGIETYRIVYDSGLLGLMQKDGEI